MNNHIFSVLFAVLASLVLGGCGAIEIVPVPARAPVHTMQFSRPAEMPAPPPAAYLRRGLGCKVVDSSYESSSRSTMAVKVDVEDCRWIQWSERGHQQTCRSRSRFTTYLGKNHALGTVPETRLDKVTDCTWRDGGGRCHLVVDEEAKLVPNVEYGTLRSYRKVHTSKPYESLRCR